MAEIEITTAGELKLAGDIVGHIAWVRPFIESDVAGLYDDFGNGYDEWGDLYGFADLDDLKDERDELESERNALLKERDDLQSQLAEFEQKIKKRGIIL